MRAPSRRRVCSTVGLAAILIASTGALLAQNENETVGFQSNHLFEGQFGENIDILNGGMNLGIPIGPSLKVSANLGYQLSLNYHSKVWDTSDWGKLGRVELNRRSNMGLGFGMNFGRIYRDITLRDVRSGDSYFPRLFITWIYVSPDGNEHELGSRDTTLGCALKPNFQTTDTTYINVSFDSALDTWDGRTGTTPKLYVSTPEGLRYTLAHVVQTFDSGGAPYNTLRCTGGDAWDPKYRDYNRDFGGWYVTLIEDTKSDTIPIQDPNSSRQGQSGHAAWVEIAYETAPGFEHAIKSIVDSAGRKTVFNNNCERDAATGQCLATTGMPTPPERLSVRTESIEVPAFAGQLAPTAAVKGVYSFTYEYLAVENLLCEPQSCPARPAATNLLRRIELPEFDKHAGSSERYAMTFEYGPYEANNGELHARTLPTGPKFYYYWAGYGYFASSGRGGYLDVVLTGFTRQLVRRQLILDPVNAPTEGEDWRYSREEGGLATNPSRVSVKDPAGNEIVYYYHASVPEYSNFFDRSDLNDGYAPEWEDGLNYRTEFYQGNGSARKLVRSEARTYAYDPALNAGLPAAQNIRLNGLTTVYNDDDGRQSTVAYGAWNYAGQWRMTQETGFEIPGTRTTYIDYFGRDPSQFNFIEVHDGRGVLSRADNVYDGRGRLEISIARAALPLQIRSAHSITAAAGDVVTTFAYDALGNPVLQEVSDQGVTAQGAAVSPSYRVSSTWQAGGYPATRQYFDWGTGTYFPWKSQDVRRDGNTGLVFEQYDTAGVRTAYSYDSLGRMRSITPAPPEHATQIEYKDLLHTTMRRGDPGVMGDNFSCSAAPAGDYIMTCHEYDSLGRLVKTQNRPSDPARGIPYRTAVYDVLGRLLSAGVWTWPGEPVAETRFDYSDPGNSSQSDPFGRPRRVTTPDGKVKEARYFGLSESVTVRDLRGAGGQSLNATTTYYRDAWGRLVNLETPPGGGASAAYGYDLRGNLIYAELREQNGLSTQVRTFEYDGLGRQRSSSNPENGSVVINLYDPAGEVLEETDASGSKLISVYDGAGRLLELRRQAYRKPGAPAEPIVTIQSTTYDVGAGLTAGRVTQVRSYDDAGTWVHSKEFIYQGLNGRMSAERDAFDGWAGASPIMVYEHNNFGSVSSLRYPEGPLGLGGAYKVAYAYKNGFPTMVWDPVTLGAHAVAAYNAGGGFEEVTTYGGVKTLIDPDSRGRPDRIVIGPWNYSTNDFSTKHYDSGPYTYDGAGNVSVIGANRYGYDRGGRLVEAEVMHEGVYKKQIFSYDGFGNLLQKNQYDIGNMLEVQDRFAYGDSAGANRNRILALRHLGDGADRAFLYDIRGNLALANTQAGIQQYDHDARSRLISARRSAAGVGTELARYRYDSAANRVRKDDAGRDLVTFYVRDARGRLISEFRRARTAAYTPEWAKHYIYLGNRLVGLRENLVPTPPAGLIARTSPGAATVSVSWKANPPGEGVGSYKLYRAPQGSTSWSLLTTTASLTYADTPPAGALVQYQVTAVAGANEGYGSNLEGVLAGDGTYPSVPTGLTAAPGDRRVDLKWIASPRSDAVVGYHVYRGLASSKGASRITAAPAPSVSFVDLNAVNGTQYRYRVTAVDSIGLESSVSAAAFATPGLDAPPGPPGGVLAVADCAGSSAIQIVWEAAEYSQSVSRHLVYREPAFANHTGLPSGARSAGPNLTYSDTETEPGMAYRYWVVAVDARGNVSAPSISDGTTARYSTGTVPTPDTPTAASGDGRVTLRVPVAAYDQGIPRLRVYRKPNAALGCGSYESVADSAMRQAPYTQITDAAAPNNVAYDYVVVNVDSAGRESAFSKPALGVPLGRPTAYSECVEDLGQTWGDGTTWCPNSTGGTYRRIAVRWQQPAARPYQPIAATSADGTLGYLKGYRVYEYDRYIVGTWPNLNTHDLSSLVPRSFDWQKSYCRDNPDVSCRSSADCPGSNPWCLSPDALTGFCKAASGSPQGSCVTDRDCPSGQTCYQPPSDAYLVKFGDGRIYHPYRKNYFGNDCLAVTAVYKVYANGNWLTAESDFSDNFDGQQKYNPYTRCLSESHEVCCEQGQFGCFGAPRCPSPREAPPTLGAPRVSTVTGGLSASWDPPAGVCEATTREYCSPTPCPVGYYCPPCPEGSACEVCDRTKEDCGYRIDGVCRAVYRRCGDGNPCPSGQSCDPRSDEVGGYRIYVTELPRGSLLGQTKSKYHFVRPAHSVTVDGNQTSYTFTGLAPWDPAYGNYTFSFRVAAIDRAGRTSDLSPPSPPGYPGYPPLVGSIYQPTGLKTIVWTSNDATTVSGVASPRGIAGIKLAWQGGSGTGFKGFRVWRSARPGGPYCALLRSDPGLGFPVCLDPNAYAGDSVTVGATPYTQLYVDRTAEQNTVYYYAVTTVTNTGESAFSEVVAGMELGHESLPLSPPAYVNAQAPSYGFSFIPKGTYPEYKGIYLSWCSNPPGESVTAYKIYRSKQSMGPHTFLAEVPPACLDGKRRCEITSTGVTEKTCNPGISGNCRLVDLTVDQSLESTDVNYQVNNFVYYYVLTAVRRTQDGSGNTVERESSYSQENAGWPNYEPPLCLDHAPTYPDKWSCYSRYDHDNFPDIPCGDETAALGHDTPAIASARGESGHAATPHQTVGGPRQIIGDDPGPSPPPPPSGPPTPNAVPRFLYYHLDHLGSPRVITNAQGSIVSRHHYMPYGEEIPLQAQNSTSTLQFTGHERDEETRLDYMRARYYSPAIARMLEIDRGPGHLIVPQSLNRYTYAWNNPIRYLDPSGRNITFFYRAATGVNLHGYPDVGHTQATVSTSTGANLGVSVTKDGVAPGQPAEIDLVGRDAEGILAQQPTLVVDNGLLQYEVLEFTVETSDLENEELIQQILDWYAAPPNYLLAGLGPFNCTTSCSALAGVLGAYSPASNKRPGTVFYSLHSLFKRMGRRVSDILGTTGPGGGEEEEEEAQGIVIVGPEDFCGTSPCPPPPPPEPPPDPPEPEERH